MRVIESAARIDLADVRVAVCGDWHGNVGVTDDGRRVNSLGQDGQQGNVVFLDMALLTVEGPSLQQMREARTDG